jgi:hypothetical protein
MGFKRKQRYLSLILASGQEQLASADQLVNMSVDLGNVITVLSDQIGRFNINK